MCVAENTSHGAKCRIVRLRRTTEAWSEVPSFLSKKAMPSLTKGLTLRCVAANSIYFAAAAAQKGNRHFSFIPLQLLPESNPPSLGFDSDNYVRSVFRDAHVAAENN